MTDDITTGKIRVGNIEIYISRDGQDATLEEAAQALAEAQASINGILQDLRGGQITTTPIREMAERQAERIRAIHATPCADEQDA